MTHKLPLVINLLGKRLRFPHVNCHNALKLSCSVRTLPDIDSMASDEMASELEQQLSQPTLCFNHWITRVGELLGRQLSPIEIGPCEALLIEEAEFGLPLPRDEVKRRIQEILQEYKQEKVQYIMLLK